MTEDMVKKRPERSRRQREMMKTFWRALARRKPLFRLVKLVELSRRKICEDMRVLAMMCIGKMTGCVVLQ